MGYFAASRTLISIACVLGAVGVARVIPASALDGAPASEPQAAS